MCSCVSWTFVLVVVAPVAEVIYSALDAHTFLRACIALLTHAGLLPPAACCPLVQRAGMLLAANTIVVNRAVFTTRAVVVIPIGARAVFKGVRALRRQCEMG